MYPSYHFPRETGSPPLPNPGSPPKNDQNFSALRAGLHATATAKFARKINLARRYYKTSTLDLTVEKLKDTGCSSLSKHVFRYFQKRRILWKNNITQRGWMNYKNKACNGKMPEIEQNHRFLRVGNIVCYFKVCRQIVFDTEKNMKK